MTSSSNIALIGMAMDLGAESMGVDMGADALRQKKIIEKLEHIGLKAQDLGNVKSQDRNKLEPGDPKQPYLEEIVRVNGEIAKQTEAAIRQGQRVVALGGDHSINLGVMSGASAAVSGDIGLIYIDAHGDMNTPETSISHNVHGMHLASLMGWGPSEMVNLNGQSIKLAKENLLHIAGADFDQAELDLIKREDLKCFTMFDLLATGLGPLFKMVDELAQRVANIWVSADLDAIDSVYAPGTGIPNHGGLTYREVAAITEYLGKRCPVIGVDLVEYNPLKDNDGITAELGIEIIAKVLGTNYSWYTNYMDSNLTGGSYVQKNKPA